MSDPQQQRVYAQSRPTLDLPLERVKASVDNDLVPRGEVWRHAPTGTVVLNPHTRHSLRIARQRRGRATDPHVQLDAGLAMIQERVERMAEASLARITDMHHGQADRDLRRREEARRERRRSAALRLELALLDVEEATLEVGRAVAALEECRADLAHVERELDYVMGGH